jgi:hypothetical protein
MRRILRDLVIAEISAVDKPVQKGARAVIMKREDEKMEFTKADADRDWNAAQAEYAKHHNLSFDQAAIPFSKTKEGKELFAKSIVAPPGPPIVRKAAPMLIASAKSAFPTERTPNAIAHLIAVNPDAYDAYNAEKHDAGII